MKGKKESSLGSLLKARGYSIAVAESCTGGMISSMITSEPGCSAYFLGGCISYGNEAKALLLGVRRADLKKQGAVSEEVSRQMARGVQKKLDADIGVGVTGIAGPSGGTRGKPVGTVYISVANRKSIYTEKHVFKGRRDEIRRKAAFCACSMVKNEINVQP